MKAISFYGTCLGRQENTLVSKRISTPFSLKKITIDFPIGCNNLMKIYILISSDDSESTSGKPSGISVFQDYGQVEYLVGNGQQKIIYHDVDIKEKGTFIKVYAVNDDFYDHDIDVQVEIEL